MSKLVKPKGIIIHHSLTKDGQVVDWDAIKRYHVEHNGWSDIGYHFGVEQTPSGVQIITGRPINMVGAHTVGKNDCIGICVVGNYDLAPPPVGHMNALIQLTLALLAQFPHLTPDNIHPHSKFAPKSCPGKCFPWNYFITQVRAKRGKG